MLGLIIAMIVAYLFPYARVWKAVGFIYCGPQNFVFSHFLWRDMLKKQATAAAKASDQDLSESDKVSARE